MERQTIQHVSLVLGILCVGILLSIVGFDEGPSSDAIGRNDDQFVSDQIGTGTRAAMEDDPCVTCHKLMEVMLPIIMEFENSSLPAHNASCIDCHVALPTDLDAISHNGYYITHIPSPADCGGCHPTIAQEFEQSLHSFGVDYYEYLYDREKLPYLESQVDSGFLMVGDEEMDHAATLRGCQGCHGTNMTGKNVDDFTVWPNNGIGRINPDGSKGSCVACHTRHKFSAAEARKPETCGQCHLGPDHPQIEMYYESKHGSIYLSEGDSWNWTAYDWDAGEDYRTPTCSVCHMSATADMPATHDVSSRLSWELETAVSRRTDNTANSLGVPISDGSTWQVKRSRMESVCKQCHSPTWVENYFMQGDLAVELYNQQYNASKAVVDQLYADGLLTSDSFDEPIEFEIYEMWHHEGRRARMGAFMMAPDYVQWHGFYELLQDKAEIEHMDSDIRAQHAEMTKEPGSIFLANNGFDGNIHLRWMFFDADDIDHYDLYWSTSEITDLSGMNSQATTTDEMFVTDGLSTNTSHYFYVEAIDGSGAVIGSAESMATPTNIADSQTGLDAIEEKNAEQDAKLAEQDIRNQDEINEVDDSVSSLKAGTILGLVVVFLIMLFMGYHGMTNIKSEISILRDSTPRTSEKPPEERKSDADE